MIETYIPLYRKYRPQQLGDLVGQEMISTAIGNALTLNKITHAYLFCGPRGTGKTSTARILAKSLNCVNGPTPTPCQVCPSCIAITRGSALDVTEIDAASNNGVDNIRDLTDKVQFSPIEGKFKIYIIDEVHMLSTAAFNALLKTLEEPPPNVVFIFATTEPHKVLPTIISRCQRFDFSRITRPQIEARLKHVAQLENIAIQLDALTLIAQHVRGGLRDALGLLDQVAVLGRGAVDQTGVVPAIRPQDVRVFIGVLDEELLLDLTQGIVDKNPAQILQQIQHLQERGVEPPQMVKELTRHFRNLLLAKTCGPNLVPEMISDLFELSPESYQKLHAQAQGFAIEELPQLLSRLSLLETQIRHSHQPQLWFEIGLLDLCYRQEIHLVKDLAQRVEALEQALQNGPAPQPLAQVASRPTPQTPNQRPMPQAAAPKPLPVASPAMIQPPTQAVPLSESQSQPPRQDLHAVWTRIIDAIGHMPTKALVKDHFTLTDMSDKALTIGFGKETNF